MYTLVHEHFMVVLAYKGLEQVLNVYDVVSPRISDRAVYDPVPTCTLGLPRAEVGETRVLSILSNTPSIPPKTRDAPPFSLDPDCTAVVVSISVGPDVNHDFAALALVIPYRTLCAQADAGASHVAGQDAVRWDDWGVRGSLLLTMPPSAWLPIFQWDVLANPIEPFGSRHPVLVFNERRVVDEKVLPQWIGHVLIFDVHPAAGRHAGPLPEAQSVGGEDGGSWAAFFDQMTVPPSNTRSSRTTLAYDVYRSPPFYLPHGTALRQLFATQDGCALIASLCTLWF